MCVGIKKMCLQKIESFYLNYRGIIIEKQLNNAKLFYFNICTFNLYNAMYKLKSRGK
jgi:hypothetical protein